MIPRSALIATVLLAGVLAGLLIPWFGGAYAVQTENRPQPVPTLSVIAATASTPHPVSGAVAEAAATTVGPIPTPTALPPTTVLAEPTEDEATETPTPVSSRALHQRWLELTGGSWKPFPIHFEWATIHDDVIQNYHAPKRSLDPLWVLISNGPASSAEIAEAMRRPGQSIWLDPSQADYPLLQLIDSYDPEGRQRWYLSEYGLQFVRALYQIPGEILWEANCRNWSPPTCPSDEALYIYRPG